MEAGSVGACEKNKDCAGFDMYKLMKFELITQDSHNKTKKKLECNQYFKDLKKNINK